MFHYSSWGTATSSLCKPSVSKYLKSASVSDLLSAPDETDLFRWTRARHCTLQVYCFQFGKLHKTTISYRKVGSTQLYLLHITETWDLLKHLYYTGLFSAFQTFQTFQPFNLSTLTGLFSAPYGQLARKIFGWGCLCKSSSIQDVPKHYHSADTLGELFLAGLFSVPSSFFPDDSHT